MTKLKKDYYFKALGTSITVDLHEGHTVFASAHYNPKFNNFNVHMAVCVTPTMRNELELDSLPLYNVFATNIHIVSERNTLKSTLRNKVGEMYENGELEHAISEIDIINEVLNHSEDLFDKITSNAPASSSFTGSKVIA
jgi:hypothetical protein